MYAREFARDQLIEILMLQLQFRFSLFFFFLVVRLQLIHTHTHSTLHIVKMLEICALINLLPVNVAVNRLNENKRKQYSDSECVQWINVDVT